MSSDVYFVDFRSRTKMDNKSGKLRRLLERVGYRDVVAEGDLTAVKLHFGERGNDGFLRPIFVRQVVDKIREAGGKPFLTDTNTLYTGSRKNSVDHLITAIEHGFDYAVAGAPLIIADGLRGQNYVEVPIEGKHFDSVKIAGDIVAADSMVVLSHFKGHAMAGFGGAIKNLAMGCAPAEGKKAQHSARMTADPEKCIGCGMCVRSCPVSAIGLVDGRASINKDVCIGCGECLTVCPKEAIFLDWKTDLNEFLERLAEYAAGAAAGKAGRILCVNFLMDITPECDCVPWSDAAIVPDIGIVASIDPVALDRASLDLVNRQAGLSGTALEKNCECGEDKFGGLRDYIDASIQISHAEEMGLGSSDYRLVEM